MVMCALGDAEKTTHCRNDSQRCKACHLKAHTVDVPKSEQATLYSRPDLRHRRARCNLRCKSRAPAWGSNAERTRPKCKETSWIREPKASSFSQHLLREIGHKVCSQCTRDAQSCMQRPAANTAHGAWQFSPKGNAWKEGV